MRCFSSRWVAARRVRSFRGFGVRIGIFPTQKGSHSKKYARSATTYADASRRWWPSTSGGLCGVLEVSDLRIERTLESGPRGASFDIGGEALVACDDVGVLQDSEHGAHHEFAGREAVAIEKGLV